VTPCSDVANSESGISKVSRNVGVLPLHYAVSQPRSHLVLLTRQNGSLVSANLF